jgi:hypothetical protein
MDNEGGPVMTDSEMIDAFVDAAIEHEERRCEQGEMSDFLSALFDAMTSDYCEIVETLEVYRSADETGRAAIDNFVIQLVGYSVPSLLQMARLIAGGMSPEDARSKYNEGDDPVLAAHKRIQRQRPLP